MTEAELLASLRPLRLRAAYAAPGWADLCVAFSLGLLAGASLFAAARPFLRRKTDPVAQMRQALAALRDLPPTERLARQARLLADCAGTEAVRAAAWHESLYTSRSLPDPEALDRVILAAVRRRPHA